MSTQTRFGVEEEFFLLDPETLAPAPAGSHVGRALTDGGGVEGELSGEFLTCQVEHATAPVRAVDEARAQMRGVRGMLQDTARADGIVLAATGTPYDAGRAAVSPSVRYTHVARRLGRIADGHHVSGLHVHVEIEDAEERVRALNRLRPWLPLLLSVAGDSPFWHGHDTGYASWRTILMRRLPTAGCPPLFRDHEHYRAHVDRLIRLRAIPDAASLSWAARLSDHLPTVEVRVADAQLDVDDALLIAALCRALLTTDESPVLIDTDPVDAALWTTAREGVDAGLLDPLTGDVANVRMLLPKLLDVVRPRLDDCGDREFVEDRLARIGADGTGAERQRRAFDSGGPAALARLLTGAAQASMSTSFVSFETMSAMSVSNPAPAR